MTDLDSAPPRPPAASGPSHDHRDALSSGLTVTVPIPVSSPLPSLRGARVGVGCGRRARGSDERAGEGPADSEAAWDSEALSVGPGRSDKFAIGTRTPNVGP